MIGTDVGKLKRNLQGRDFVCITHNRIITKAANHGITVSCLLSDGSRTMAGTTIDTKHHITRSTVNNLDELDAKGSDRRLAVSGV